MAKNLYQIGDRIKLYTSEVFRDEETQTPFDPDSVIFEVKDPSGAVLTIPGTKIATGDYLCEVDVDDVGEWFYYLSGTTSGDNRGAAQGSFLVQEQVTA